MRMYLISDNRDTLLGMRLGGVEGIIVHHPEDTLKALRDAVSDSSIAVIAVTEKVALNCREYIDEIRLGRKFPLIVEIPDRHGKKGSGLLDYVKETVGLG